MNSLLSQLLLLLLPVLEILRLPLKQDCMVNYFADKKKKKRKKKKKGEEKKKKKKKKGMGVGEEEPIKKKRLYGIFNFSLVLFR